MDYKIIDISGKKVSANCVFHMCGYVVSISTIGVFSNPVMVFDDADSCVQQEFDCVQHAVAWCIANSKAH